MGANPTIPGCPARTPPGSSSPSRELDRAGPVADRDDLGVGTELVDHLPAGAAGRGRLGRRGVDHDGPDRPAGLELAPRPGRPRSARRRSSGRTTRSRRCSPRRSRRVGQHGGPDREAAVGAIGACGRPRARRRQRGIDRFGDLHRDPSPIGDRSPRMDDGVGSADRVQLGRCGPGQLFDADPVAEVAERLAVEPLGLEAGEDRDAARRRPGRRGRNPCTRR